jgi:hypothetical protein
VKAGRELDMLVAEKVMGWKRGRMYGNGNGSWIQPPGTRWHRDDWSGTPDYSEDIKHAWMVVDAMGGNHKFTLQSEHGEWFCSFDGGPEVTDIETPELAICLAALKAKEQHGTQNTRPHLEPGKV